MKFTMSGNLLRFSNFRNEVEVAAPTVAEGVKKLCEECPQLTPVLFDGEGRMRNVHRLFLNGDVLMRDELHRAVGFQDEVTILTAIAGG